MVQARQMGMIIWWARFAWWNTWRGAWHAVLKCNFLLVQEKPVSSTNKQSDYQQKTPLCDLLSPNPGKAHGRSYGNSMDVREFPGLSSSPWIADGAMVGFLSTNLETLFFLQFFFFLSIGWCNFMGGVGYSMDVPTGLLCRLISELKKTKNPRFAEGVPRTYQVIPWTARTSREFPRLTSKLKKKKFRGWPTEL